MPWGLSRGALALLGSALALLALAAFAGGGSTYDPLVWIGGLAVIAAGAALVLAFWPVIPLARLDGFGIAFFACLAALLAWMAASTVWSVEPDRSWEYFNRGAASAAFAPLGLVVGSAGGRLAVPLAAGGAAIFGA